MFAGIVGIEVVRHVENEIVPIAIIMIIIKRLL